MIRIKFILFTFTVLLLLPSVIFSQSKLNKKPVVSVSAGVSAFDVSDHHLTKMYKPSYGGSIQVEHPLTGFASVGIETNLSTFSLDESLLPKGSSAYKHLSLIGFNFFAKIQPEQVSIGKFQPFFKAGLGAHLKSSSPPNTFPAGKDTYIPKAGMVYTGGAGVNYSLNEKNSVFIESAYRVNAQGSGNVRYNTMNFNLGFRHQF